MVGGFRGFSVVWLGQFVSLIGSGMTRFAFTIWAFEETGSAAVLSLVFLFAFAPGILLSPVAGALVDRYNRKAIMIFSDTATALSTVALLALHLSGNLQVWHLYFTGFFASSVEAFQFPAFSAAVTVLVHKDQYGRASAMRSVAEAASSIIAPLLAGVVFGIIGLTGIMLIDLLTFAFAFCALLAVIIPQPPSGPIEDDAAQGSLWRESIYGWRYIWRRKSLLGMQMVFLTVNFAMFMVITLLPAMILIKTSNDELAVASVQSLGGIGGLVGSLTITILSVPRRRVHGVFIGMMGIGGFGVGLLGLGDAVTIWGAGLFIIFGLIPLVDASNQAIWQAKVPPNVQGRVFATRRLLAQGIAPISILSAGFLAEGIFEPAMQPDGALAPLFGSLVGTGDGEGMALMLVLAGAVVVFGGAMGYVVPTIRQIETRIPDFDAA